MEQNATKNFKFARIGDDDMFLNDGPHSGRNMHRMSQSQSGYQDYPESATRIRASNGNLIDLDGGAPFIGLNDKMDRYLDGNSTEQHPLDFTEVDPNNPRGGKGAKHFKNGKNPSKK